MSRQVAIVGQSFRLPGPPPEEWWEALVAGRDLVTKVDPSRFEPERFLHPDPRHPGTTHTFAAGVIDGVGDFDAAFFGISPREAALIDPQQRLLLEMSWEALESAGIRARSLRGTPTAVFVGISSSDYAYRLIDDLAALDGPGATGNAASIAANRLSWFFDLRGPSMAIDTACSSSLVAFHQACQAIRSGESTVALAGGVSLLLHPFVFVNFSKASMLSRQGRCRVFDASADGYVRAEGGGVLVLKSLDAALRDGNPILAVVAGSGINTDGHTVGLTVPSVDAQAALLRRVYDAAECPPESIDYLEAHGTGTPLGDPIETRAISEALARRRERPLPIGSVKSNIGHLEAASGMAGLVKALHCLKHRFVAPTIGVHNINPQIPVADWNLDIVTQGRALRAEGKLVIGVNSFGFGGANAHVILETAESPRPVRNTLPIQRLPVVVSGADAIALRDNARRLAATLEKATPSAFAEIAHTLIEHRDWLPHRLLVEGAAGIVAESLRAFADGESPRAPVAHLAGPPEPGKVALVYSGNGAQWEGMGRRLLAGSAAFRDAVSEVDSFFSRLAGFSLLDELLGLPGPDRFAATEIAQPCLFALQVGLTRLLRSQGLQPDAVVGHSVGEIAAAWASGALSLETAVEVVHVRSQLQGKTRGSGVMTAVGLGAEEVLPLIGELALTDTVVVAARNSARATTLAGPAEALTRVEQVLSHRGIFARRLNLDYAFHSPAMDALHGPLLDAFPALPTQATHTPFFSTVTGSPLDGRALDGAYWWRNIREPVSFAAAIGELLDFGVTVFLEVGPHPVLSPYLRDALREQKTRGLVVPAQSREEDSAAAVWRAGAQSILAGARVDWPEFFPRPLPVASLPSYAWQRRSLWHPVTPASGNSLRRIRVHPLLGFQSPGEGWRWENQLDTQTFPELADHRVRESTIFPAAGYLELALAAAAVWQDGAFLALDSLEIRAPLLLGPDHAKDLLCVLDPADGRFVVKAKPALTADGWVLHASCEIAPSPSRLPEVSRALIPHRPPDFEADDHYARLAQLGLEYGPAFRCLRCGWREGDTVIALLGGMAATDTVTHLAPGLVDAAFQLALPLAATAFPDLAKPSFIPVRVSRLVYRRDASPPASARIQLRRVTPRTISVAMTLFDEEGHVVANAAEVDYRCLPEAAGRRSLRQLTWRRVPLVGREPSRQAFFTRLREGMELQLRDLRRDAAWERQWVESEPLLDTLADYHARLALETWRGAVPRITSSGVERLRRHLEDQCAENQAPLLIEDGLEEAIDALKANLLAENPDLAELVLLIDRTGRHLPELLSGVLGVAELHPRGLDLARLQERTRGNQAVARLARGLEELLRAAAPDLPCDLLEVAEGAPLLLSNLASGVTAPGVRYRVASPTARVLGHIRSHWSEVETESLESGPNSGEFALAIVNDDAASIAAQQVLLRHACARLASGGSLLMMGQWPARWVDFVLGGTEDWFIDGTDGLPVGRQQGPAFWCEFLKAEGFAETQVLSLDTEHVSGPWLIVARATSETPATHSISRHWLLAGAPEDALVRSLVQTLAPTAANIVIREHPSIEELKVADTIVYLPSWPETLPAGYPEDVVEEQASRCTCLARGVAQMEAESLARTVHVVGRNPLGSAKGSYQDAVLWGFARTLMNETEHVNLRLLGLESFDDAHVAAAALVRTLSQELAEDELLLTPDGGMTALRLVVPDQTQAADPAALNRVALAVEQPGSLESLRWVARSDTELAEDEVEVAVEATGLNFRDLMLALGLLPPESVAEGFAGPSLGLEFAGTVTRAGRREIVFRPGDRVLGYGAPAFADVVRTRRWALAPIPHSLSFEAAATIPTAFVTAWYACQHLAHLKRGESILIHGAAGGVGLAAIQVARFLGAEIHATVSAGEKREFLQMLGVENLYDSRSLSFADEILAVTQGAGVDVVINSLSGHAIARSLEVLKPFGRFIELGKRDYYENTRLGLRPFRNNISYFGVDVDQLMVVEPELARRLFDEVIQHFVAGDFTPLPHRVFDAAQVVDAFRHMQSARHIGKVVIAYPNGVPAAPPVTTISEVPLQFGDGAYLITGGLSGLGLVIARWLAERGARHLWLCSRSGQVDSAVSEFRETQEARGVTVHAVSCDITDPTAVDDLLMQIRAAAQPLRGIIHAAAVYDDALARNLDAAQVRAVLAPKVRGALNLDSQTAHAPPDFFLVISSATTFFGNPGQSAYVAANHWLEAFTRSRQARGLATSCLSLGPLNGVGYLERHRDIARILSERLGGRALEPAEALQSIGYHLSETLSPAGVLDFHWPTLARHLPSRGAPKFSALAALDGVAAERTGGGLELREQLRNLTGSALREAVVSQLRIEVGSVLGLAPGDIDSVAPAHALGLDSLMGVELAVAIETSFGVRIPEMSLAELSLDALAGKISGLIARDLAVSGDDAEDSVALQFYSRHEDPDTAHEVHEKTRSAAHG